MPILKLDILPEAGRYVFEGRPCDQEGLRQELGRQADRFRQERSGTARAWVRISLRPGADFSRVAPVVDWCLATGLDKVETPR